MKLFAPEEYWKLSKERKDAICNGCGAKGIGGWLVPDTMWGLNVRVCCDIHDYMYSVGTTIEDKRVADRVFLNNVLRVVEDGAWILRALRRRRAKTYFFFVDTFGGPAFWDGKNKPEEVSNA